MWIFVSTGHLASCAVLCKKEFRGEPACSGHCEATLYLAVGILALVAGSIEVGIGLIASAFAFSEGMHSLADGAADFYGRRIARLASEHPERRAEIRKHGGIVIAALLVFAALPILWEMWRRFEGTEAPSASLMVFAGAIATAINGIRWLWLMEAEQWGSTSTRRDLVEHAKTDTIHGAYLFTAGALLLEFADVWTKSTQLFVDLTLSGGVFCYILWRAWNIVRRHEHHHKSPQ